MSTIAITDETATIAKCGTTDNNGFRTAERGCGTLATTYEVTEKLKGTSNNFIITTYHLCRKCLIDEGLV